VKLRQVLARRAAGTVITLTAHLKQNLRPLAVHALTQTIDRRTADHPPLTGWTTGRHWLLAPTVSESGTSG
jgi:DNA-binding MurR/RpiR family transcriptional regulator